MLERLREAVLEANLEIVRRGLVVDTFGNASGIDREAGLVAIKPSGVAYEELCPAQLVITDLDGQIVEGSLRPSSDLATHLELYKAFPEIGGVVHTHSRRATVWAQAGRDIPCLGTTHADYFYGSIPVTAPLTVEEIASCYERNTGLVIARTMAGRPALEMPAVLVHGHAPFVWGRTPAEAAKHALLLEEVAALAADTLALNPHARPISQALIDKHFLRKHGPQKYYGQPTC
jgi:L-ribulose-5-phosphate 4-epimerase